MDKIIAYCGLVCSSCPSYLATQADDDQARAKTAAYLADKFGIKCEPSEINCDGCPGESGRIFGFCQGCEIRRCAREKGLSTCADCAQAPCESLAKFHQFSPEAKAAFAALRG